jgi:anaerobic nitric oxide reductase flavorubredoxin
MPAIPIKPGIYWIGVNDRTTDLFEGVWPIGQTGVSYNSYLILDEKKALVDLAKAAQGGEFLEQIYDLTDPATLDYVILNHMEPDHTGVLNVLRQIAPQATLLCTAKALPMLAAYYGLRENIRAVADGEELPLGEKRLRFVAAPFVHWPETMVTYELTQRVLFSCDAFGGYGALRGALFDDQCTDLDFYLQEALRYYANIVASFSGPTLRAIEKLAGVPLDVVAPSHGLVWRRDPQRIVQLYKRWAQYATQPAEPGVTLVYGSMYGHTERMMNAVAEGISAAGVPLQILDAARTHVSFILPALWTQRGVMLGAPTYESGLFPPVAHVLDMAGRKRIQHKQVALFGSFGWSGGAERECKQKVEELKWSWWDSLIFNGHPTAEDLHRGIEFGRRFAEAVAQS